MKAFIVGFIFLVAVTLLAAFGVVLFPLLVALSWLLRFALTLILFIFAIWLLGKLIILVWEKIR